MANRLTTTQRGAAAATARWPMVLGLPVAMLLSLPLGACGAPAAAQVPAVTVSVATGPRQPVLVPPSESAASRALYGRGCGWLTRSGDAVVCFDAGQPDGGPATMTRYATTTAPPITYLLYAAGRHGEGAPPSPRLSAARDWLRDHRLRHTQAIPAAQFSLSADKQRFFVRFEGEAWTAPLPAAKRLPAGRTHVAACCAPALRALVLLPDGTPAAVVGGTCSATSRPSPCPAVLIRTVRAVTAAQRAAAAAAKSARAAQRAADEILRVAASAADGLAPARFVVEMTTTKGTFRIQVIRVWAPHGVDRFYRLVQRGFFRDVAFFRVIPGFMAQFGVHGSPAVANAWRSANVPDDPVNPVVASNQRGFVTFAKSGPNTRSTQLFINFRDNANLDRTGFPPIGRVMGSGMNVVEQLYNGYGEGAPRGRGPDQSKLQGQGNAYLRRAFPRLDYIRSARVVR